MTSPQIEALQMLCDAELCDCDNWAEAREAYGMDQDDEVDFESFESVSYSCWIYARMAKLILDGDDDALRSYIEKVDPKRLVRDKIKEPT